MGDLFDFWKGSVGGKLLDMGADLYRLETLEGEEVTAPLKINNEGHLFPFPHVSRYFVGVEPTSRHTAKILVENRDDPHNNVGGLTPTEYLKKDGTLGSAGDEFRLTRIGRDPAVNLKSSETIGGVNLRLAFTEGPSSFLLNLVRGTGSVPTTAEYQRNDLDLGETDDSFHLSVIGGRPALSVQVTGQLPATALTTHVGNTTGTAHYLVESGGVLQTVESEWPTPSVSTLTVDGHRLKNGSDFLKMTRISSSNSIGLSVVPEDQASLVLLFRTSGEEEAEPHTVQITNGRSSVFIVVTVLIALVVVILVTLLVLHLQRPGYKPKVLVGNPSARTSRL